MIPKHSSEGGSTIVSVLVALGLLGIVGTLYFSGAVRSLKANKIVESKEKYNSIEGALVNEVAGILRQVNSTQCLPTSTLANRPFGFEGGRIVHDLWEAVQWPVGWFSVW